VQVPATTKSLVNTGAPRRSIPNGGMGQRAREGEEKVSDWRGEGSEWKGTRGGGKGVRQGVLWICEMRKNCRSVKRSRGRESVFKVVVNTTSLLHQQA
jgi:hypothetical protein